MSNIVNINNYCPNRNDRFFFDTNIWIYLFCPIANYKPSIVKKYSAFLKKLIQVKASIFISSLVLSEFFNTYARIEFNLLKRKNPKNYKDFKKDFRGTERYKKLVREIERTVKIKILKVSRRLNDKFRDIDLDKIFKNIEEADFNDSYYIALLYGENIKIITNDYDFVKIDEPVSIITANPKLLEKN